MIEFTLFKLLLYLFQVCTLQHTEYLVCSQCCKRFSHCHCVYMYDVAFTFRWKMNQQCRGHRKLVHMDVTKCAEMSNTVDGTKCLREPMSVSAVDSKISRGCGLLPRPSRKSVKSHNESFQSSTSSAFNGVDVDSSDTEACRPEEPTVLGCSSNDSDNVSESAQPRCSVEFVSARKYMNPTLNLLDDHLPQNNAVTGTTSIRPMHGSMQVSKANRKPNSKHTAVTQKNSLDRYFKPVTSTTSMAEEVAVTQSQTVCAAEHGVDFSLTPENTPRKTVLLSPITKLPGSDTIYYCSPSSQNNTSRNSVTSSQNSSSALNMSKIRKRLMSEPELCDDDELDYEASFDFIWKTDPQMKHKSAKQSNQSSKKTMVRSYSAEMSTDKLSNKSVRTGFVHGSSSTAHMLQQNDADSSDMSAQNFGLFGFSNNTLLALDSDTDFEEDTTDYFASLPPEVVSNILCRLPFTDLCLNVNRVCLSWKNIINSDNVSYVMVSWLIIMNFTPIAENLKL